MIRIVKSLGLLTLLFLCGATGFAQTQLTLKEAVSYALQNKADAVKARMDVTNSLAQVEEARSGMLPQVSIDGNLTYNPLLQSTALTMDGQTVNIEMGLPWQSNAAVQLTQQIFNSSMFIGLKAARSTRQFYELNQDLTDEQIIEKVADGYYNIFKSQAQIETIDSTIANTQRIRDVQEVLFKSGLSRKIDLDRMQVSLNNLKSQRQQLINQLAIQENSLKFMVGMPMDEEFTLSEDSFQPIDGLLASDFTDIDNLTEVQVLRKKDELLHYNLQSVKSQSLPKLSLTANYGVFGFGQKIPYWHGKPAGVNWSDYSAIGLNLNVPLFTGLGNKAKAKQAQIDIDKNQQDIKDVRLSLSMAQKNAFTQIQNSLITLNIQKENMQFAREVVTNVEHNYKNGLADLTDLLDAQNDYANAQNNFSSAELDYKLAEIQLIKSQGNLKTYFTK